MDILFTFHAKKRMKKRKISLEKVKETLEKPVVISRAKDNKKIAYKNFREKVVEVVFVEENSNKIVISVRWG
jgi:hypothetical protein